MKISRIIEIIESQLKIKIETNIDSLEQFEQVEKDININIDIFAVKKHVYVSKKQYALSVEFVIKNETEGTLKCQHETLRKSTFYNKTNQKDVNKIVDVLKIPQQITTATNVAKYLIYQQFKYYKVDPIGRHEYNILESVGMKAKLYANPCSFKDYYDCDINSMYSFLLSNKNFRFPVTEGKEQQITEIDKTKLGIYKLKILSDIDERIFMKNTAYDTNDIELLDYLGYKYELADNTAYIYDKFVTGDKFFCYSKDLYKMRKEYPVIKDVMSSTWGACAKKNKLKLNINIIVDGDENPEIAKYEKQGYKVEKFDYHNNKCVLVHDDMPPFKFDLARLSYFLCSYSRLFLGRIISQKEIRDSLVYVHTDGFRCCVKPEDIDYCFSKKIGHLKYIKLSGKFSINKLNSMSFYNENIKDWQSYDKDKFIDYRKRLKE